MRAVTDILWGASRRVRRRDGREARVLLVLAAAVLWGSVALA